jgi:hypothetical protein
MKRFILVLVALLLCSGLFAKEKTLYKKDTENSVLTLYQSELNGYVLIIYEKDFDNETFHLDKIICKDENKIKEFLVYLLEHNINWIYNPTIYVYEIKNDDLTEIDKNIEIENNKIIDTRTYLLE